MKPQPLNLVQFAVFLPAASSSLVHAAAASHPSTQYNLPPSITWSKCPSGTPPGVDCGSIAVPLTYQDGNSTAPKGNETVTLALTRLNSTGNGTEGPLFFNPGGPGAPATAIVAAGQFVPSVGFSDDVRRAYDIIGLDPRGVGQSSPVQCDAAIFNQRVRSFVNSSSIYHDLVQHNRRLGESCATLTGPLLDHLDTLHVAKDHEVVRQALNASKFNLLGVSYGSLLGSQYLEVFPHKVGRMALDGLVDHSQSEVTTLLTEATTYEATLNRFFEWCDRNTTCALHGNDTAKVFDRLLAQADSSPIPAPACRASCQPNVTGEDIRYNTQSFLQFVDFSFASNWVDLGQALEQASRGNATLLSTPLAGQNSSADSFTGSAYAYLAIGCQDWLRRAKSATDIELRLQAVGPFAPRTAGASQTFYYQSNCLGWPAAVTNRQRELNTTRTGEAPRVLLSNSVYDPSCSIVWANGLKEQLPNAVSITRNGMGHTSFFLLGETKGAIDSFFATGKLPKDGTIYQT